MNRAHHAVRFARAIALLGAVSAGCENREPLVDAGPCGHCTCWYGDVGPPRELDAYFGDAGALPDAGPPCASVSIEASRCCPIAGPLSPPDLCVV